MKRWFGSVVVIFGLAFNCYAQTAQHPKKTALRINVSSFSCPDDLARTACKSYEELLKAKDEGIPNTGYVCFRQNADEFFVISFNKPLFPKHWDEQLKEMTVNPGSTAPGHGLARGYKDGVQNTALVPSVFFRGTWYPYTNTAASQSNEINFKKQDENNPDGWVSIDPRQVSVSYKYQNRLEKVFTYQLTIQRSTGRFSESFQEQSEKVPLLDDTGRCVYRNTN